MRCNARSATTCYLSSRASEKRCTGIFGARTGHRSYNPDSGRWLNRDPFLLIIDFSFAFIGTDAATFLAYQVFPETLEEDFTRLTRELGAYRCVNNDLVDGYDILGLIHPACSVTRKKCTQWSRGYYVAVLPFGTLYRKDCLRLTFSCHCKCPKDNCTCKKPFCSNHGTVFGPLVRLGRVGKPASSKGACKAYAKDLVCTGNGIGQLARPGGGGNN